MHIDLVTGAARPVVAGTVILAGIAIAVWVLWFRKNVVAAAVWVAASLGLALVVVYGINLVAFEKA